MNTLEFVGVSEAVQWVLYSLTRSCYCRERGDQSRRKSRVKAASIRSLLAHHGQARAVV